MFNGLGEAFLFLAFAALFGVVACIVFAVGSVAGIWLPVNGGWLTLSALGAGGLACLIFAVVFRP